MASGQFPITYATKSPERISQTTPMSVNLSAPSTGLEYVAGGLNKIAGEAEQLNAKMEHEKKRREAEEKQLRQFAETKRGEIALAQYDADTEKELMSMTDPDKISEFMTKRSQVRSDVITGIATTPEATASLNAHQQLSSVANQEKYERYRFGRVKESALGAFNERLNQQATDGDFAGMVDSVEDAYEDGFISADRREGEKDKVKALVKNWNLTNAKIAARNAYNVSKDKQDAYAVIDRAEKNGEIDIDGNKELGDWLDGYVSGREKEAAAEKREYANKFSMSALDALNSKTGLSFDFVYDSKMSEKDKNMWANVSATQHNPPATKDNWDHYQEVMQGLTSLERGAIDQKDLIDRLVRMRYTGLKLVGPNGEAYGNREYITDETYQIAVNRIKNPLPKGVANDFAMVTSTGGSTFDPTSEYSDWRPWNKDAERKRIQNANNRTEDWIRSELKAGRTPKAEEMNRKAEQFLANPDATPTAASTTRTGWLEQFQTPTGTQLPPQGARGLGERVPDGNGEVWEIVGFNEAGTAMVDKVLSSNKNWD